MHVTLFLVDLLLFLIVKHLNEAFSWTWVVFHMHDYILYS